MGKRVRMFALFVALLLPAFPMYSAVAQEDGGCGGGGGGCDGGSGTGSTPNLVIAAGNQQRDGVKLTLTAQTGKDASAHGNLVYDDGAVQLKHMDVHRVMLHEEPHNPNPDPGCLDAVRASVRGTAVNHNGEVVRVRIDIQDRGTEAYVDRLRVRVRPFDAGHEPHIAVTADPGGGQGECDAEWIYDTHWMNIHRLKIHQR